MSLLEIAELMEGSGYDYRIIIDDVLSEGDTAFIFNSYREEPVGKITLNMVDDIVIRNEFTGKEFTFVDATDVIMWIVQNL